MFVGFMIPTVAYLVAEGLLLEANVDALYPYETYYFYVRVFNSAGSMDTSQLTAMTLPDGKRRVRNDRGVL